MGLCVLCSCVQNGPPTCHGVLPGLVFALAAMVTGIASRLVVCLPLLQCHHLPGRSRGTRYKHTHTDKKDMFNP